MRRLLLSPCLVLLPASAAGAAPALAPLEPCYRAVPAAGGGVQTEPVTVTGSGFTPGATVNVAIDGVDVDADVPVDAQGAIRGAVAAPPPGRGTRLFTVSATEPGNLAQTASAQARVVELAARITPRRGAPRRRVRFRGTGFTAAAPVYAHYVRAGRTRRTVRLGRARGACGTLAVRRRQFAFRPAPGRWRIRLDQERAAGTRAPAVTIVVRVR